MKKRIGFAAVVMMIAVMCFGCPVFCDTPESVMLARVNQIRAEHGVAALSEDPVLDAGAVVRAAETLSLLSHTRPDGTQYYTVIPGENCYAENIGRAENIDVTINEWMNSQIHHDNMLNPAYTHVGVAKTADAAGNMRWILLFTF